MTSKSSFFKVLRLSLGQRLWGFALSCIFLFFAFPVYAKLTIDLIQNRLALEIISPSKVKQSFAQSALGEGNKFVFFVVAFMALYLAINGFNYLYSKSKVDLIHSLPVKREKIFLVEYVSGIITFIVPYLFFMCIAFIVGAVNNMMSLGGLKSALIMLFINLLGFLGVYNTCIIAVFLTGTIAVGLAGSAVLLLYGTAISLLRFAYEESFFITRSSYSGNGLATYSSPIVAFFNLSKGLNSLTGEVKLNGAAIIAYIIFVALTFGMALVILQKRQMESVGKSIVFKKVTPVISILLLIPITLAGALFFNLFTASSIHFSFGWYVFGFLAALILGHLVIQAIFYQDFKSLLKNLCNPAIAGLISAVIAAIYLMDLTGYDTYIPTDAELESAAIASYGMQGNVQNFDIDGRVDEYGNKYIDLDLLNYRLDNMTIKDKELVRDFANAAIECSLKLKDSKMYGEENEDEYYQKMNRMAYVNVRYNLKNGKVAYREYSFDLNEHMDIYNRLYLNPDYKKIVCPMMGLDEADATDIRFAGIFGDEGTKFSPEDMKALVKAYKEDVSEQDAYHLKSEVPFGFLYQHYTIDNNGYLNVYETHKAFIYPSFKRTTAILAKYDITMDALYDADNVAFMEVIDYSSITPDGQMSSKKFTKKEDIQAILNASAPSEFTAVESILTDVEDIGVNVCFKETPYGYQTMVSYNIFKGQTPKCVKN